MRIDLNIRSDYPRRRIINNIYQSAAKVKQYERKRTKNVNRRFDSGSDWRKVKDSGSLSLDAKAANVISTIPHRKRQAKGAAHGCALPLAESYRLCANLESQIKEQSLWTAFLFPLPIRLSCCAF